MKTVARAPARIDPAGGGTDAPPYSIEYGGCVVNFSVARYSYAQLQWLERGAGVHLYSLDLKQGAWAPSIEALKNDGKLDFVKGFVRRLLRGHDDLLMLTQSDVPVRTGLGGSGAMGVAITATCLHATNQRADQTEVARLANEIERSDMGLAGGVQDSYGAAIGGAKRIVCRQGGGVSCGRLNLRADVVRQLERDMLLIYTGGVHLSEGIHQDIKRSYTMVNSPTIAAMDRLKAAACRMADALEAGDIDTFADMLIDSRRNHYALHESCDSQTLRTYFDRLGPHILGGKTCGAGGGGFIAVLSKPGHKQLCIETAESLGGRVWPFKLDEEGVVTWQEQDWSEVSLKELQMLAQA